MPSDPIPHVQDHSWYDCPICAKAWLKKYPEDLDWFIDYRMGLAHAW